MKAVGVFFILFMFLFSHFVEAYACSPEVAEHSSTESSVIKHAHIDCTTSHNSTNESHDCDTECHHCNHNICLMTQNTAPQESSELFDISFSIVSGKLQDFIFSQLRPPALS